MCIETKLNKQLANWSVLYVKLHQFHWYVTGSDFFTLHEKFEEFYTESGTFVDEIAERILTIGGKPLATMKEYLEVTCIEEGCCKTGGKDMVETLIKDYELLIKDSREIISACEDKHDEETADLFRGKISELEKTIWMLKAYLG